ncbi:MAG TPA: hypothetical protein VME24_02000 [Alphaproteobacteria bacterium]|nr:hypothetical protein [Alphaproteobacteria bacterium]
MKQKIGIILSLFVVLLLIRSEWRRSHYCPGSYFKSEAVTLELTREDWIRQGRPTKFDLADIAPKNECFIYTNSFMISNQVIRCCFAGRSRTWPAGTFAISEEGITLWIPDKDKQIIFSPEVNGVPWSD